MIYYTLHFCWDKLLFSNSNITQWLIVVGLVLLSIVLNLWQNHRISTLEEDLFHYLQGSREMILDIQDRLNADNGKYEIKGERNNNEPLV
jgi:hypothetical protein